MNGVPRIDLIPTPNGNGTLALRAARPGLLERIRRWLRARSAR